MSKKVHVKVGDTVYVRTGKDKAAKGKVRAVFPKTNRVLVEGVNMVTKHHKPTMQFQSGGIAEQEAPISASNVMLICEHCNRPSKTGRKFQDNGDKVRYCKACGEVIDVIKEAKKG
ncbi:MAG: 50S ribosomal protein L24 [Fastidiosipilaceae bacterium]|jgi:large subunit ribosomal protein L24|nr:50S ribosomal protein L24 [Clostridiaceae bacterium]